MIPPKPHGSTKLLRDEMAIPPSKPTRTLIYNNRGGQPATSPHHRPRSRSSLPLTPSRVRLSPASPCAQEPSASRPPSGASSSARIAQLGASVLEQASRDPTGCAPRGTTVLRVRGYAASRLSGEGVSRLRGVFDGVGWSSPPAGTARERECVRAATGLDQRHAPGLRHPCRRGSFWLAANAFLYHP